MHSRQNMHSQSVTESLKQRNCVYVYISKRNEFQLSFSFVQQRIQREIMIFPRRSGVNAFRTHVFIIAGDGKI